jgi:hypothetical protein
VVVLKRSIVARKNEHRKHVIKYMEENVKLLHDYSDANQNVRNLAYHIKALQVNPNSKNLKILHFFRLSHVYIWFKSISSNVILTCQEHNHRKTICLLGNINRKTLPLSITFLVQNFAKMQKNKK